MGSMDPKAMAQPRQAEGLDLAYSRRRQSSNVGIYSSLMFLFRFLRHLFGKRAETPDVPVEALASPLTMLSELPESAEHPSQEEIDAFQRPAPLPWTRI